MAKEKNKIEITEMSRAEVKGLMDKQARAAFGKSARAVLASVQAGKTPNNLAASHLSMLDSLQRYGKE